MWMKIKVWMYRRGLNFWIFNSPSAAFVWHRGTLFHPGPRINDLGGWAAWSKSLSQQYLSKQNPNLDPKKED